jgi:primary-amine oxidase
MGDFATAMMLTKENAEYQEALKKRGITDLELVQIDPWPAGGFTHESIKPGHRAFKCISFLKESLEDNAYARPIQGVIAWVDLTLGEVVHVEDHGVIPMPTEHARYDAGSQPNLREGLKPIDINQPEGSSFEVDGYQISWQGWKFRISVHDVEGLVLHQLSLHDRPILYRAALSDMVVPYGDSDPMHSW